MLQMARCFRPVNILDGAIRRLSPSRRTRFALLLMTRIVKTACPLDCFDACGVVAEVDGDRIVRLGGDPEHPFTRGALCRKVNRFLVDRQYNPERITYPMRRGPHGWDRVTWDEALDLAAP